MTVRLRTVTAVALFGLSGLFWPQTARADYGSSSSKDSAIAALKRQERLDKQITYGSIGGSVVVVTGLIFATLNAVNKRSKAIAERNKRQRQLDPDAPLESDVQPESAPPID